MHYFGNPGDTQSIIAYMILIFLEVPIKNCVVGMLLKCPSILQRFMLCINATVLPYIVGLLVFFSFYAIRTGAQNLVNMVDTIQEK